MFMPGHFKNGPEGLNNIRSSFLPYLLQSGTKEHKKTCQSNCQTVTFVASIKYINTTVPGRERDTPLKRWSKHTYSFRENLR